MHSISGSRAPRVALAVAFCVWTVSSLGCGRTSTEDGASDNEESSSSSSSSSSSLPSPSPWFFEKQAEAPAGEASDPEPLAEPGRYEYDGDERTGEGEGDKDDGAAAGTRGGDGGYVLNNATPEVDYAPAEPATGSFADDTLPSAAPAPIGGQGQAAGAQGIRFRSGSGRTGKVDPPVSGRVRATTESLVPPARPPAVRPAPQPSRRRAVSAPGATVTQPALPPVEEETRERDQPAPPPPAGARVALGSSAPPADAAKLTGSGGGGHALRLPALDPTAAARGRGGMNRRSKLANAFANGSEDSPNVDAAKAEEWDRELDDNGPIDRLEQSQERAEAEQQARAQAVRRLAAHESEKPTVFIPDQCYVRNTYLGGNAGYVHSLRRLDRELAQAGQPHRLAVTPKHGFDPPHRAGLALSANLSTRYVGAPQRVFLQVGLRGSERYGWRRPPVELVLVVDGAALADGGAAAVQAVETLLSRLSRKDRLAVVIAGPTPVELASLSRMRSLRSELAPNLQRLANGGRVAGARGDLAAALLHAGKMLSVAGEEQRLHGTQLIVTMTAGANAERVRQAEEIAHALTLRGIVTSFIELGAASQGAWWQAANAGYGNYHNAAELSEVSGTIAAELDALSRVVGRLLRVNIGLGPDVKAVRVLGSHVLTQARVAEVKAREEATDRALAAREGIESDRGEDDDGIQVLIPYFYGGDSHVVMVELWVEGSGPVAEVTLKYKDMLTLGNSTARTAVSLRNVPRPHTGNEHLVVRTLGGYGIAEALDEAAQQLALGDGDAALRTLTATDAARPVPADRQLLHRFRELLQSGAWRHDVRGRDVLVRALRIASERRIGGTSG